MPPDTPIFDAFAYLGVPRGAAPSACGSARTSTTSACATRSRRRAACRRSTSCRAAGSSSASARSGSRRSGTRPSSTSRHAGRRVDEAIEVCKRLWTEETVTHHGEFFYVRRGRVRAEAGAAAVAADPRRRRVEGRAAAARRASATAGSAWATRSSRPRRRSTRCARCSPSTAATPNRFQIVLGGPVASRDDVQRWEELGVTRLIVSPWRRSPEAVDGMAASPTRSSDSDAVRGRHRQSASRRSGCARSRGSSRRGGTRPATTPGCIVWQTPAIDRRELGRRRGRASRSMPRPMPMSHARRSTIARSASSSGSVASAQRMKPPRHGAASNGGCGSTIPSHVERPRRARARRRPRAARRVSPVVGVAAAGSRRRTTRARPRPRAACVIAWHAASNWCVQFCFGSVHSPGGGEAARQRHARELPAAGPAASGHVAPRPAVRLARRPPCTVLAVVAQRDHEVVEVVLELATRRRPARRSRPGSGAGTRRRRGRSRVGEGDIGVRLGEQCSS